MKETPELLTAIDPVMGKLQHIMYQYGIRYIHLQKGTRYQQVHVEIRGQEPAAYEKRQNKDWEEMQKVR